MLRPIRTLLARLVLAAIAGAVLSGCATQAYSVSVSNLSPSVTRPSAIIEEEASELDWEVDYPVTVHVRGVVEGVRWQDSELVVEDKERFEVLGNVLVRRRAEWSTFALATFFYIDMHDQEGGRDLYCKIQLPFRVLTGGLWAVVPFQYPCFAWTSSDSGVVIPIYEQELRRAAHAMGGDLVFVEDIRPKSMSLVGVVVKTRR
jgi:hypothetical protein